MAKRKLILHYHLFKNAGSSIDKMLERSFGKRWCNYDNPEGHIKITANQLSEFIAKHPRYLAISSHQAHPPLPTGDLELYPIIILRHPLLRAYSAYRFEWHKAANTPEPRGTFEEYITFRFKRWRGNAIEAYQTIRLSHQDPASPKFIARRPDEEILAEGKAFLEQVGYFGIVEQFPRSLEILEAHIQPAFEQFKAKEFRLNVTQTDNVDIATQIARIESELAAATYQEFLDRNSLDYAFYDYALKKFAEL